MVSLLVFYSDDPSLNPVEVYNFSVKLLLKRKKINEKETVVGPFFELEICQLQNMGRKIKSCEAWGELVKVLAAAMFGVFAIGPFFSIHNLSFQYNTSVGK